MQHMILICAAHVFDMCSIYILDCQHRLAKGSNSVEKRLVSGYHFQAWDQRKSN